LEKNPAISAEETARKAGTSVSTVRRRIKALTDSGVIAMRLVVDPKRVGLPLAVIIAVDVTPRRLGPVIQELGAREEVTWVASTTGRHDILISARFSDSDQLTHFIEDILGATEGVRSSETYMLLRTVRRRFFDSNKAAGPPLSTQ
jgi:DNA-binding Lrp family transcriptional regulator